MGSEVFKEADEFVADRLAISRLYVRGLLTGRQKDAAVKKLAKAIQRDLRSVDALEGLRCGS